MAQWARALAQQAWGPEFQSHVKVQHVHACIPAPGTQKSPELTSQPATLVKAMSFPFSERS